MSTFADTFNKGRAKTRIHVLPCVVADKGTKHENVERPQPGQKPEFWGIYRNVGGFDTWLADRMTKAAALKHAARLRRRAKK